MSQSYDIEEIHELQRRIAKVVTLKRALNLDTYVSTGNLRENISVALKCMAEARRLVANHPKYAKTYRDYGAGLMAGLSYALSWKAIRCNTTAVERRLIRRYMKSVDADIAEFDDTNYYS